SGSVVSLAYTRVWGAINAQQLGAGAEGRDKRRRDEGDAGHRGGAATKQTAPRRAQPSGLVPVAADLRRRSSSTMSPHRLLLAPCISAASGTSETLRISDSPH